MAALRIVSSNTLRAAAYRTPARLGGVSSLASTGERHAFSATPRVAGTQSYGEDPPRQPAAADPQRQPSASAAQTTHEHPGPDPPDVGKGTGAGPTKGAMHASMQQAADAEAGGGGGRSADKKKQRASGRDPAAQASAESGGSRSQAARETGSSPTGGDVANASSSSSSDGGPGGEALKGPQGRGAPKPKIHNQNIPGTNPGLTDAQKREVEQHNREFDRRHDRAEPAGEDKVDKKFWQGTVKRDERTGIEIDWNA